MRRHSEADGMIVEHPDRTMLYLLQMITTFYTSDEQGRFWYLQSIGEVTSIPCPRLILVRGKYHRIHFGPLESPCVAYISGDGGMTPREDPGEVEVGDVIFWNMTSTQVRLKAGQRFTLDYNLRKAVEQEDKERDRRYLEEEEKQAEAEQEEEADDYDG